MEHPDAEKACSKKMAAASLQLGALPGTPPSDPDVPAACVNASTRVLYWSPAARLENATGQYRVVATREIAPGELLLLEHVLVLPVQLGVSVVSAVVMTDPALYDQLWPRDGSEELEGGDNGGEKGEDARSARASLKVQMNIFVFDGDKFVLGSAFSKFNHACRPNCHMTNADAVELGHGCVCADVYGLWAVSRVRSGEELCIDYTMGGGADVHAHHQLQYGWACDCDAQRLASAQRAADVRYDLVTRFRTQQSAGYIQPRVDAWLRDADLHALLVRHCLAAQGVCDWPGYGYVLSESGARAPRKVDPRAARARAERCVAKARGVPPRCSAPQSNR